MPILNYTTKINPIKTIGEITQSLVEAGANKIIVDYENSQPVSLNFQLIHNGQPIYFALPANWKGVLAVLKRQKGVAKSLQNEDQAIRVSWRILKVWVDAQLAIIESEIVTAPQVFLPYAITKSGNTLYDEINNTNLLLTE